LYEHVGKAIFSADLRFANLESTLTAEQIIPTVYQYKQPPLINAPMADYNTLTRHKGLTYSVFNLANNHIMDRGWEGYETTVQQLDLDGIAHFGTNDSDCAANKGLLISCNGMSIAFIGFTEGLNGKPFPPEKPFLVNVCPFHRNRNKEALKPIIDQIVWAKNEKADCIIVSLHWGFEYELFPTPHQIEVAHELAEQGAHIIIGHHPHCIQPWEFYRPFTDSDRMVPIFYSLGNLVANKSNPHIALSIIARVEFQRGKYNGTFRTMPIAATLIPVYQRENVQNGQIQLRIKYLEEKFAKFSIENGKRKKQKEYWQYLQKMARYCELCGISTSYSSTISKS